MDKKTMRPKIWVYKDKVTGAGKGEATVTFDDPNTVEAAINWFNGKAFIPVNRTCRNVNLAPFLW